MRAWLSVKCVTAEVVLSGVCSGCVRSSSREREVWICGWGAGSGGWLRIVSALLGGGFVGRVVNLVMLGWIGSGRGLECGVVASTALWAWLGEVCDC